MTTTKKKATTKRVAKAKATDKKAVAKKKSAKRPSRARASDGTHRKTDSGIPPAGGNINKSNPTKPKTFMDEQKEDDELDARLGRAAKHIKECHALVKEAAARLAACKMATSTLPAIKSDLVRVDELAIAVTAEANAALVVLRKK